ncbi:hypothetical protein ABIE37_002369 [Arthrobacter bambusae]|uniref:Uncharacterized protein n=2 Tax=Arthrobacter bambusae TaxID=1338426 RepID=A0ABV2P7R1_9MICC
MHIREFWSQLSPDTQQWLIDNPGSMIVPRTMTAIFNGETGEDGAVDIHGGTLLTADDQLFIREQAHLRGNATAEDPRFFDSVGPED